MRRLIVTLSLLLIAALAFPAAALAFDGEISFVAGENTTTPVPPFGIPVQGVPGALLVPPGTGNYSMTDNTITTKGEVSFWWTPTEDQIGIWVVRLRVTDPGGLSDYEDIPLTVYSNLDVNRDLVINILDLILVGQHFSENGAPGWINEDVEKDGAVNILDLIKVAQGEWRNYNVRH